MDGFKKFFIEVSEVDKNVRTTLAKIPKAHSDLIKGYKFKWEAGNVLKGDKDHVGIINPNNKTITIAAPLNFPREFTLLHELAHQIWSVFMTPELRKEWAIIVKKNQNRDKKENDEENWCHAYAQHFVKNKLVKFQCTAWDKFIEKIVKLTK